MERGLIEAYEDRMRALLPGLAASNLAVALQIASVPEHSRGFGHVKVNVQRAQAQLAQFVEQWRLPLAEVAAVQVA